MKHSILCFLFIVITAQCRGQDAEYSVLLGGGASNLNIAIAPFGGGGPDDYWHDGPIFFLAGERTLSKHFSIHVRFALSIYSFNSFWAFYEPVADATNIVTDAIAAVKFRAGFFYALAGAGHSLENAEAVLYLPGYKYYELRTTRLEAKRKLVFAGLLGIGFEVDLSNRFSAFLEGNLNMREYAGVSAFVGLRYTLK